MVLGIGTGSTVNQLIEVLKTVKSSSRRRLEFAPNLRSVRQSGIPELDLNSEGDLALYIDGADEATAGGMLIKGAAPRSPARRSSRRLPRDSSASRTTASWSTSWASSYAGRGGADGALLRRASAGELGGQPVWREGVVTDNGNVILDVHRLRLRDPVATETAVNQIAEW